ncbi:MAG: ferritin-like domain-containing protein [Acidimicrobiales bacterium]
MTTDHELNLGELGLDRGGHLLIGRELAKLAPGERLHVGGTDPNLSLHVPAWARSHGHQMAGPTTVVRGDATERRLAGAQRAGGPSEVLDRPRASWGVAARGALVEDGGPSLVTADLDHKDEVWSELAPKLYAQAAAAQWDPASAIDWTAPQLPDDVENAVVQVMTYLVENEQAALMVPARFLGRIHPHFREVQQFLATQIADEARHVEVFAKRAQMTGRPLGFSGAGGRASLQTLFDEPDWGTASFLLSTLGEGTFLSLLSFLVRWAPDPVTGQVARLALQDEARHVAFSIGHLREHLASNPRYRDRLRAAAERRHDALAETSGLSEAVFDSLVLLAAGSWTPEALAQGWDRVMGLQREMDDGRQRRLVRLGFSDREAAELSALHTKNFM